MGFFKNIFSTSKKESLDKGLEKSKTSFFSKLNKIIVGKSKIDNDFLDDLEEILISSDVGVNTTLKIIERIESRVAKDKYTGLNELNLLLKEEITLLLSENESLTSNDFEIPNSENPYVIMVLANQLKSKGLNVILGAGDTFRAAAIDQLQIWADRVGIPIIKQEMGSDPASVAFDTLTAAKHQNADVVIIDTAGRLHNKVNLMNELSKIKRVMQKVIPNSPQEILLILDGSTGQNAFEQAKQFISTTDVNSLAITKLDGTAKGGVVIGISDEFKIPVKYIGVGEAIDDLQTFNKHEFIDSFFR